MVLHAKRHVQQDAIVCDDEDSLRQYSRSAPSYKQRVINPTSHLR
jgi:hypothetical protein